MCDVDCGHDVRVAERGRGLADRSKSRIPPTRRAGDVELDLVDQPGVEALLDRLGEPGRATAPLPALAQRDSGRWSAEACMSCLRLHPTYYACCGYPGLPTIEVDLAARIHRKNVTSGARSPTL